MAAARRQQQQATVDFRSFPQMQQAERYRTVFRSHIDAMFASYNALLSAAKTHEDKTKLHSDVYAEQEALNLELQTESLISSANKLLTEIQRLEHDRLLADLEAISEARAKHRELTSTQLDQLNSQHNDLLTRVTATVDNVVQHTS
eukprot:m.89205 g.89205  ORF g.89205 m.89205 type:complete len:146 (+) comp14854_c0_seq2:56-493(+)